MRDSKANEPISEADIEFMKNTLKDKSLPLTRADRKIIRQAIRVAEKLRRNA